MLGSKAEKKLPIFLQPRRVASSHSPAAFILNSIILNFRTVSLFLVTKRISFNASDNLYVSIHLQGQFTLNIFPKKNTIICLKTRFSEVIL